MHHVSGAVRNASAAGPWATLSLIRRQRPGWQRAATLRGIHVRWSGMRTRSCSSRLAGGDITYGTASVGVVDFQPLSGSDAVTPDCPIVEQLHSAFSTVGFVFLTNHGIDRKLVDQAIEVGEQFFSLPEDTKKLYSKEKPEGSGYVAMGTEHTNPTKPTDIKQSFDIGDRNSSKLPDASVLPSFRPVISEVMDALSQLALRVLQVMGHGLKLKDPQYFVKAHANIAQGDEHNLTFMRLLNYPPLPPVEEIKPGQLRCGEHVDYGSITLLFQDSSGGLQVKRGDGTYIDVPYVRDAVLVNLGAIMQRWTADVYSATPHRVLLPEDETARREVRRSMIFFAHPDRNTLVECVDGSDKYPAITAAKDTLQRRSKIRDYK